jgi:predicted transcriptional regulator
MDKPTKYEWDGKQYVPFKGTPGADAIEWDGYTWVPSRTPEGPNSLSRGLATGWEQTKGLISEVLPAMAQNSLGYDNAARANLQAYKERMDRLKESGYLAQMSYEDVKGLGSLIEYGGEAIGQALPSMATALIPGIGVGAAATRFAAGRAASGLVASRAAAIEAAAQAAGQTITKEAAAAEAMRQVSRQIGTAAGAVLGSGIQNIPESFANIYDETQEMRPGVAFAVGSLKTALDSIAPVMLLRKTQGVEMGDRLTNLISSKLLKSRPGWSGALAGALETAATEGLTEGSQELLDQAAVNILADKSIEWNKVVDAALKGGIGAAPVGAGAGAIGARRTAAAEEEQRLAAEQRQQEDAATRAAETQKIQTQRAQFLDAVRLPEAYALAKEYDPEKLVGAKAPVDIKIKRKLAMRQNLSEQEEGALVNMSPQEFERYLKLSLAEDPEIVKDIPEIGTYDFMNETPPPVPQGAAPTALDTTYKQVVDNIPFTEDGYRDSSQFFNPAFLQSLQANRIIGEVTPDETKDLLARLQAEGEVVQKGAFFRFTTEAEKEAISIRRDPKLMEALSKESPDTKMQKRWLEGAIGRTIEDPTVVPKVFKMLENEGLVQTRPGGQIFWRLSAPLQIDRTMRQRLFAMGYEPAEIDAMSPQQAYDIILKNSWAGNVPSRQRQTPEQVAAASAEVDQEAYNDAVALVREQGSVGISSLRRNLGLGPERAQRIIERMEQEGVVSAPNAEGYRTVLPVQATEAPAEPAPAATTEEPAPAPVASQLTEADLNPEERALVEKGKQTGRLTYEEVNAALPITSTSFERTEAFISILFDNGIELVDGSESQTTTDTEQPPQPPAAPAAQFTEDEYAKALELVRREGKAGTTFIQRHFQMGYDKAKAILDRLESEGVVSPPNEVGKRTVLTTAPAGGGSSLVDILSESGAEPPKTRESRAIEVGDTVRTADGYEFKVRSIEGERAVVAPEGQPDRKYTYKLNNLTLVDDEPGVMRSATEREVSLGIDREQLIKQLSIFGYSNTPAVVAAKEMVQNAFDAVKEAIHKGQISKGNIDVTWDDATHTMVVKDNGVGMTPDILERAFFSVLGTKKDVPNTMRSGGMGKAKMGIFTMSDRIEIETVRDGKKSTVTVTGEEVVNSLGGGSTFKVRTVPTKEENGTKVTIKLRDKFTNKYSGEEETLSGSTNKIMNVVSQPWLATDDSGNIMDIDIKFNNKPVIVGRQQLRIRGFSKVSNISFPWGDIEVYILDPQVWGWRNEPLEKQMKLATHKVLSSGAYQFDAAFGKTQSSPGQYPADMIFNVKSKVAANDKMYPFNDQRENFRDTVMRGISALNSVFARMKNALGTQDLAATMAQTYVLDINGKATLIPSASMARPTAMTLPSELFVQVAKDGQSFEVMYRDAAGKKQKLVDFVTGARSEPLQGISTDEVLFHNNLNIDPVGELVKKGYKREKVLGALREFGSIFMSMKKTVQDGYFKGDVKDLSEKYYIGVGTDSTYYGLNAKVPFTVALLNPMTFKGKKIAGITQSFYTTMIHEIAHIEVFDHDADFISSMGSIENFLEDEGHATSFRGALEDLVSQNFQMLQDMKGIFDDSNTNNRAASIATGDKPIPSRIPGSRGGSLADALRPFQAGGEFGGSAGYSRGAANAAEQQVAGRLPNEGRFLVPQGTPEGVTNALSRVEQAQFRQMEGGQAFENDISCG